MLIILPTVMFIILVLTYEWVRRKRRRLHRHKTSGQPGSRRHKQRVLRRIRYVRVYLLIGIAASAIWIVVDLIRLMPDKPDTFHIDDYGNISK